MSTTAPSAGASALRVGDLFAAKVTRDIPPVVYFHEQSPEKLAAEVSEYIVTGGYPESDPRARRVPHGIHEGLVQLLRAITRELARPAGPELPASWISGFYGSGKSSFAKLLGLALDGARLPDGVSLATALIRRDDSPRASELAEAWHALRDRVDPIAVVFDIGAVARDDEHVHSAVLRKVQARLGYCPKSNLVAETELRLEQDGHYPAFLEAAARAIGRPWDVAKLEEQADDHFSHVVHVLDPERYRDPTSWIESRAGSLHGGGTSVEEVVRSIGAMLDRRAPGKTLFIVVDEVSQYVHESEHERGHQRMLKLQSLVSDLGQRLKGRAWILTTGQQKLDDAADPTGIGKLKDRFPAALRVHLAATNIRDVVHKRLLKKDARHEAALRQHFQAHRPDLKLHAYGCEEITEEDFVEVYPLLPGHVDLLLRITTNLRSRSSRVQGDDHAIRGLLQLMGELFRAQKFGEEEVGALVTLDRIYDIQATALDADTQMTLARIFEQPEVRDDRLACRVAKAVALLELVHEQVPTHAPLVARCLYARLGAGDGVPTVTAALERLRALNLLGYSEKDGYCIQSMAGQEWQRERENHPIAPDKISELVQTTARNLFGNPENPRLKGRPFPFAAFFSDGKYANDVRLKDTRDDAAFVVDLRFLGAAEDRTPATWVKRSDESALRDRLVWVSGETGPVTAIARDLARAEAMIARYDQRRESLAHEKKRLLIEEQNRAENELSKQLAAAVSTAFMNGALYFRSRALVPRELGGGFGPVLNDVATRLLPELYPYFVDLAITEAELKQLLEASLSGPSTKFMDKGLGILSLDSNKYVPSCAGEVPQRILKHITDSEGIAGALLLSHFGKPPYGYAPDVIRACVAGLLRAGRVRIRPEGNPEVTSIRDPGVQDLFLKDRPVRRADIFPGASDDDVSPRDIVRICKLFQDVLGTELERDRDAIADAVFSVFPARREALREVERRFDRLPGRGPLPPALVKLSRALEDCCRSRHVREIAQATKRSVDALRDGLQQLAIIAPELTDEAIERVRRADETREHHLAQLRAIGALGGLEATATTLEDRLKAERPWRDPADLDAAVAALRTRYADERRRRLAEQGSRCEAAKSKLKLRKGFVKLTPDESEHVLRPFAAAVATTTAEAVAPSLVALDDMFTRRLTEAARAAEDLLDELLSRGKERIVRVEAQIAGREVASEEELRVVLKEIEDRVREQLKPGVRVRIV